MISKCSFSLQNPSVCVVRIIKECPLESFPCDIYPNVIILPRFSAFLLILASSKCFHMFLGVFLILASCKGFYNTFSRHFWILGPCQGCIAFSLACLSFSPLFPLGLFHRILYSFSSKLLLFFAMFLIFSLKNWYFFMKSILFQL